MRRSGTLKRGKTTYDNRKQTAPPLAAAELGRVTAGYQLWLVRQPLSPNTRRTYLGRVRQYCAYLRASGNDYGNPLSDLHARDYAIRDFKSHLKKSRKAKPATINLTLAAPDNLYLFLGLGRPNVRREDLPKEAPRALEPEEQKRFMRAVERCTSIRDRAIALLLFYTALRVGECASLDTNDIALSARKGKVTVRAGRFTSMGHGRRLGRSIYSRFNSAWDFAMQRARTSIRWLTGCWHAPWNTTNQACCFSSRVSICTLKK